MTDGPKVSPPDAAPKRAAKNRDGTTKSKVTDVQDPLIAGDAGKGGKRLETNEATVDEAGQIRRNGSEVDLLH